ncbi:MAG: alginate lyase family protein, partial [Brevefilum sp.]
HWSLLEELPPDEDIKYIWEPGRFGWALTLARAYAFSGNPAFARDFWQKTTEFLNAHPPNLGRQWESAQEVAIRLMAMVFCDRVFGFEQKAYTPERRRLWQAIAEHARRIPSTLIYSRAQNNNHLLTEAAGLYTAGLYLADHPQAENWHRLGHRWLNWGFQNQIDEYGTYTQHSANYHRLMLQVALFADHIRRLSNAPAWPLATRAKLSAATRWLWALTDLKTGQTPNLGANDGAYLFPLTNLDFHDFRPVVDAAAKAFLEQDVYNQPELSEMALWFRLQAEEPEILQHPQAPDMLRLENEQGRAFIHTAHYRDRPSHADQLHVDLWWRGVNIALDPGTYQYNASPPWDNALAAGFVHNTLTLDGEDQMTRAGRFLWLDWAQAQILAHEVDEQGRILRVTAEHDGYRRLGALHQRTLLRQADGWQVLDTVLPYGKPNDRLHEVRLAWLLPDWNWEMHEQHIIELQGPLLSCQLRLNEVESFHLVRAGECIQGEISPEPSWGWQSYTYGEKSPALMLIAMTSGRLPIEIKSTWKVIE